MDTNFGNATYDAGASATAGIQNASGDFLEYSCNTASLTSGLELQYVHP